MLSITGAHRALGNQSLFSDLDLHVARGDCAIIIGPNGAGKSTLLRCILDLDRLDRGTLTVDGSPPDDRSPQFRRLVSAETGDSATFFDLTLVEHLALLGRGHGVRDLPIDEILDDAGIGDLGDRYPHTLSSGQGQRFRLAAAFCRPAGLLVLDEPERGLDLGGQRWVASRIAKATAAGVAVVAATHSPFLMDECADHIVELGR